MSYSAKYKNERCQYCGQSVPMSDLKAHEDNCPFKRAEEKKETEEK